MILSQKESIWYDYLKIDLWLKWGKRFVKRFLDEETFWQIFLVTIGLPQQLSYYLRTALSTSHWSDSQNCLFWFTSKPFFAPILLLSIKIVGSEMPHLTQTSSFDIQRGDKTLQEGDLTWTWSGHDPDLFWWCCTT